MQKIKQFLALFANSPVWVRHLVTALIAVLISIYLMCSCGQTVKVTVRDTPSGVQISTSQTKKDSSGTNINVNPNINFNK